MERLENRMTAGKLLAERIADLHLQNPIVIALPRGGVPVGFVVASTLRCSLDVTMTKKVGAPDNPELAIGAVGEDGTTVLNQELVQYLKIEKALIKKLAANKTKEIAQQIKKFRTNKTRETLNGKDVIVVDDGLATGATMIAALQVLRKQNPRKVIVALPVAPADSIQPLKEVADEVVCLLAPKNFTAVGLWYEDFDQVSDEEVIRLLELSRHEQSFIQEREITIEDGPDSVTGDLTLLNNSKGLIIFAHGSGSSRKSPRNQYVATELNKIGFSTLLFDLLTDEEAANRANVFNIPLLARRLNLATDKMASLPETSSQPIGYFGASTGAGAAIMAAAQSSKKIFAVVSRGGRPDLAAEALRKVTSPCLLIVGGNDEPTLSLNREASLQIKSCELVVVPGATHLFEEEGTLAEVVEHASSWFLFQINGSPNPHPIESIVAELEKKAVPFRGDNSLDGLIEQIAKSRIVMLGEATHGTHEFYVLRRMISERLIRKHGFKFIAVEGDWPDFQRINQFIRNETKSSASEALQGFSRWPTWMWANEEIVSLVEFLKTEMVPMFGLDVYSLFESIEAVKEYAQAKDLNLLLAVEGAYACLNPFQKDEKEYARHLLQFPEGCRHEVVSILRKLLRLRINDLHQSKEQLFDVQQNARIVANAEEYYRRMLFGGPESWNVRDRHMIDTLDMLLKNWGPDSKCIIWAHNSHIGDYHATEMVHQGYVNLGGLARERFGMDAVALVGFGTYQGQVIASHAWEGQETVMNLPRAKDSSFEGFCHKTTQNLKTSGFSVIFDAETRASVLGKRTYGHRAVGVVYDPKHENKELNYVPTIPAQRYDAFVFVDETSAVHPIKTKTSALDFPETWPGGV
ncbi:erythromycin esterase family protein [Bdellovibrio sp. NC01]|uniref:erythromycin esterase family protein n=1 Tax=Bdellovibrio sp. NC01 TaxID=2220073 RepID=UPI00115C05A2|nr:erythromycin esterase family protein [Bdellovibrio sp. NC01]QDK38614.1 erythromycin esterase [Bdellovibrio sp. NC01]